MSGAGASPPPDPRLRPTGGALLNRSRRAAILCYHSVAPDGPPFLSITPELFREQLETLSRRGYEGGGHADLHAIATGGGVRRRLAFLTFDDGYLDNFTCAFPLLQEYRMRAIVFILPATVDAGGELAWPEVAEQRSAYPDVMRSLDWGMVEGMAEAGVEFGAHTVTHPHLPELGDDELMHELEEPRERISQRLGRCDSVAFPFGDWDERVAAAAAAAGYSFAFTMPRGAQREASRMSIPRIAVDHRDRGWRFALKLTAPGRRLLLSPAKERLRKLRRLSPRAVR